MFYPAILFVLAMGVLMLLLMFFIPKFQTIFSSFDGHLPLITQIIIGASHACHSLRTCLSRRVLLRS